MEKYQIILEGGSIGEIANREHNVALYEKDEAEIIKKALN